MITIVADSTAYLTREETKQLGVKLVPITYNVAGISFNEMHIGNNGNFEKLITQYSAYCKTAQTNVSVFLSAFDELLRKGHEVLCLTLSSRLSGTYSSASAAARETGKEGVIVVDSLTIAGGMRILIQYARKLIDEGKTLAEVADMVEAKRDYISIMFSVDDMMPLRRSGRLGFVRQSVSTILNIKPILRCEDGSVTSDSIARGEADQLTRLVSRIPENTEEVVVHYISDLKRAVKVAKLLETKKLAKNIVLRKLGPVLGIHLGLGVVGVVWSD